MIKKCFIITVVVLIISLGLSLLLVQTGIVTADDITVTIEGPESPTNVSPFQITVTFNGIVTGFELEDDLIVDNGTASNLQDESTAESTIYTVDITPTADGLVTVDIGENVVTEGNAPAETFSLVYDSTAPTVTIETTSHDPTGNSLIPVTIIFSEEVAGLTITEVDDAIENASIQAYVSGPEVTSMIVQAIDFGEVTITIPAGVSTDAAGNDNLASETFSIMYIDQPWVTINQSSEQDDPTNVSPILYDVVFSEAVTGFEAEDVDLSESEAPGELIAVVTGEEDRYSVSVSGMTGPGKVIATIFEGAAINEDEKESLVSTSSDNEVTFQGPVPTVLAIERVDNNPANVDVVGFYVKFSEAVYDVDLEDFSLTITGEIAGASLSAIAGEGDQRFVSVLTGTGAGTLRLDLAEDADIVDSDAFPMIDLPYTLGEVYDIRTKTFTDVPISSGFWPWIERLFDAGITAGCTQTEYCPELAVSRGQMAIFLEKGKRGADHEPDAATGEVFTDVAIDDFAADWIELLFADGITDGCQIEPERLYCPNSPVSRAQMAIFLLKAKYGEAYEPEFEETSTGFDDVSLTDPAGPYIMQLVLEGITSGCGDGLFCPDLPVTREQMAIFLVKTFELP